MEKLSDGAYVDSLRLATRGFGDEDVVAYKGSLKLANQTRIALNSGSLLEQLTELGGQARRGDTDARDLLDALLARIGTRVAKMDPEAISLRTVLVWLSQAPLVLHERARLEALALVAPMQDLPLPREGEHAQD